MSMFSNFKIYPVKTSTGSMVASGSVVVAGVVELRFTVMRGSKGLFASLPKQKGNKPDAEGKIPWYPQAKLVSKELDQEFQQLALAEFEKSSKRPAPKAQVRTPAPPADPVDDVPSDDIPW